MLLRKFCEHLGYANTDSEDLKLMKNTFVKLYKAFCNLRRCKYKGSENLEVTIMISGDYQGKRMGEEQTFDFRLR